MAGKIGNYYSERYKRQFGYAYIHGSPKKFGVSENFGELPQGRCRIPDNGKMQICSYLICKLQKVSFGQDFFRYILGKKRFGCRHLNGTRIASSTSREYSNQYTGFIRSPYKIKEEYL